MGPTISPDMPTHNAMQAIQQMVEMLPIPAMIVDRHGTLVLASQASESLFKQSCAVLAGQRVQQLIRQDTQEQPNQAEREPSHFVFQSGPLPRRCSAIRQDGSELPIEITCNSMEMLGDQWALVTMHDTSEQVALEAQLRYLTHHDPLTGLGNRSMLNQHLSELLYYGDTPDQLLEKGGTRSQATAVFMMTADRLSDVNESFGYDYGEHLLASAAQRLSTHFYGFSGNAHCSTSLYQADGNKLYALIEGGGGHASLMRLAQSLQSMLSMPYRVASRQMLFSMSIGVLPSLAGYTNAEDVMRDVSLASRAACRAGGRRVMLFAPDMRREHNEREALETHLAMAIEHDALRVAYQPIVSLDSGNVRGFESMLRWSHPTLGAIAPSRFTPIAEETGMIVDMGQWAIKQACRRCAQWGKLRTVAEAPFVTVNLSRKHLLDHQTADMARSIVDEYGLEGEQYCSEIPENLMVRDQKSVMPAIQTMQRNRLGVCMDHFGTGASSLSGLHQYPIDLLKIDRSFVSNIDRGRQFAAVLKAIVTLAHNLDMTVIAEGVQTQDQVAELQALECDYAQGSAFAEPMSGDHVGEYLHTCSARLPERAA